MFNLAVVFGEGFGCLVDIVLNIMIGFGIKVEDFGYVVDVFVKVMMMVNMDLL